MEATGVYWIPLFELLAARGFEVRLVDPRQLKHVPGRKSDVLDCQWIQQLHTFGLLAAAFRPDDEICVLRSYLRQRAMLVAYAAHHIQHVQKALEQMNIKLTRLVSDVTGVTGMRIIRAILDGERTPHALAQLRDRRCQHDEETIARSLEGTWRPEHLFALRQAVELLDFYQQQIVACDREIEAYLGRFDDKTEGHTLPATLRTRKPSRTAPTFDVRTHLYRLTGVDLTRIDGIDAPTALKVVAETGLDMSRWPSESTSPPGSLSRRAPRSPAARHSAAAPSPPPAGRPPHSASRRTPCTTASRRSAPSSAGSRPASVPRKPSPPPPTNSRA
jgi:transposase